MTCNIIEGKVPEFAAQVELFDRQVKVAYASEFIEEHREECIRVAMKMGVSSYDADDVVNTVWLTYRRDESMGIAYDYTRAPLKSMVFSRIGGYVKKIKLNQKEIPVSSKVSSDSEDRDTAYSSVQRKYNNAIDENSTLQMYSMEESSTLYEDIEFVINYDIDKVNVLGLLRYISNCGVEGLAKSSVVKELKRYIGQAYTNDFRDALLNVMRNLMSQPDSTFEMIERAAASR